MEQPTPVPMWGNTGNLPSAGAATPATEANIRQKKRKRTLYSKWQQLELETVFSAVPYPDINTRERLAKIIKLPESKVQVWFQNRRARKSKSGKWNRSFHRRALSFHNQHIGQQCNGTLQSYNQRDPLITIQFQPNHGAQYVPDDQQELVMQQAQFHPFIGASYSLYEQYTGAEEAVQYASGQCGTQWEYFTQNNYSFGYGYEATLYETELEQFMTPSQMQYLDMSSHTMDESGSQTSLGNTSDLIYRSAILTNLEEC